MPTACPGCRQRAAFADSLTVGLSAKPTASVTVTPGRDLPTEVLCRPAGCRQSDFFADRSLSAVGKAGYADCLWWLSAKRVFADRDIPSCRQSPGLSAKPRFPVVEARGHAGTPVGDTDEARAHVPGHPSLLPIYWHGTSLHLGFSIAVVRL